MQRWHVCVYLLLVVGAAATAGWKSPWAVASEPPASSKESDDPAIERSRKLVRMLDDIYKQTIVLITDKYVHDEDDFPAGSAAVALFASISKGGTHKVRLLDATGEPYDPKNIAQNTFEKKGIEQLKAGADYYEQVVDNEGSRELQAMTPVPVVMQKCVMCHPHYADAKKGEPIGAISYVIPIE